MRAACLALSVLLFPGWAIAGDSVTFDSTDELEARGAVVSAFGGVDIPQGRPALRQFAAEGQEVVVVALGLMDVTRGATPAQQRWRVRAALNDLRSVRCVIWVDLRLYSALHGPTWPAEAAAFNRILAEEAPHVARWSAYSHAHRSWFRADGFHPNRVGQEAYARFLAGQVRQRCPGVQAPPVAHRLELSTTRR